MELVNSPANPNPITPPTEGMPEPGEPCPTPLSTTDVLESFERESTAWEISTPQGLVRGQTLGEGPALYFLNGLEGTSELFRLLAWLLREEFRCVLFDASRNPQSAREKIADVADLPEVRQLFAVADRHADETFLVYGSGFGGWVALAAILTESRRFHGAVLQGAYANRQFKLLERWLMFLGKRSRRCWKNVPGWEAVFLQNHRCWFPPFDAPRWEVFHQIVGSVSVADVIERARRIRNVSFADRLSQIATPILCLTSEGEGRLLKQRQAELEQSLTHCRSEWLQETGRVPHWTHPHRVAKHIRQFAETLDESPQPATSSAAH